MVSTTPTTHGNTKFPSPLTFHSISESPCSKTPSFRLGEQFSSKFSSFFVTPILSFFRKKQGWRKQGHWRTSHELGSIRRICCENGSQSGEEGTRIGLVCRHQLSYDCRQDPNKGNRACQTHSQVLKQTQATLQKPFQKPVMNKKPAPEPESDLQIKLAALKDKFR